MSSLVARRRRLDSVVLAAHFAINFNRTLKSSQLLIQLLPAIDMSGLLLLSPLDCACGCGARGGGRLVIGRLVGEGELVREGRASAPRRRGRCCQGGLWGLAIEGCSRSCDHGVCDQGVCDQGVCDQACAIKAGAVKACAIKEDAIKACAIKRVPSRRVPSRRVRSRRVPSRRVLDLAIRAGAGS